jgi:hypothetical protein
MALDEQARVVFIGGNSQCRRPNRHLGGIHKEIVDAIAAQLQLDDSWRQISTASYSWTGSGASHEGCAPEFGLVGLNLWDGEKEIEEDLRRLGWLRDTPNPLIIVGYSHGAATGFDLAAKLCREHPVSLLVTLDPVSVIDRREVELGSETWLNVYVDQYTWMITAGRPWRGNAPEARLNRLVRVNSAGGPIGHGDPRDMWHAVAATEQFAAWGDLERARHRGERQALAESCTYIGRR